jgi:hypothetical protein
MVQRKTGPAMQKQFAKKIVIYHHSSSYHMLHENKIDVVEQIATHFESMQSIEIAMK